MVNTQWNRNLISVFSVIVGEFAFKYLVTVPKLLVVCSLKAENDTTYHFVFENLCHVHTCKWFMYINS